MHWPTFLNFFTLFSWFFREIEPLSWGQPPQKKVIFGFFGRIPLLLHQKWDFCTLEISHYLMKNMLSATKHHQIDSKFFFPSFSRLCATFGGFRFFLTFVISALHEFENFSFENFAQNSTLKNWKFWAKKIHAGLEIHSMNQNLNMRIFLFLVFRQQKCIGKLFLIFLHSFHDFFGR